MKWMKERDLLIAQTMAFVQSVTGRKPEAEVFARADILEVTPTRLPDIEAMLAEGLSPAEGPKPVTSQSFAAQSLVAQSFVAQSFVAHPPVAQSLVTPSLVAPSLIAKPTVAEPIAPVALPRPAPRGDYRSEIQARVEKFRAHQARINREREAYCRATMAKVQATLDNYPTPRK